MEGRHVGGTVEDAQSAFSLGDLLARAAKTGVFRPGVDPAQLWLTIFSLCWVHLSNRHTLSWMLQDDLADAEWLKRRRDHVRELILDYLAATPKS